MIKKLIYIIVFSIIPHIVFSQEKLNKGDIAKRWIKESGRLDNPDSYKMHFDSVLVKFIANLKFDGIDTLGVFLMEYPGFMTSDSCECGTMPWIAYVHWIKGGKVFHQKITECCSFISKTIKYSALINYYNEAWPKINTERIMPVITHMDKKGSIYFEFIDHTTHYSMFCILNKRIKFVTFDQNELENRKNIFYSDNVNTVTYCWFKLTENQINEIEK